MDCIRDFYKAVETGDDSLLRKTLSPDWEMIPTVYPGQPIGPGGYWPVVQAFNSAFPDGKFEIHEIIDAAPKFTVRTTMHGTHQGEFLGQTARGAKVAFDTIDIHEVAGGVIVRSSHIEDFFGAVAQMKAMD